MAVVRHRFWLAPSLVAALALSLPAGSRAQVPDDREQQERLEEARSAEVQPLLALVDEHMAGQPAPRDFPVELHTDFLKATDQKTYVPYTVAIEQTAVDAPSVMIYLRVVRSPDAADAGSGSPEASGEGGGDASGAAETPLADEVAYEDLHFVDLVSPGRGEPYRVSRAFAVPPGVYDVYVGLREREQDEGVQTSIVKERVEIPDFFDGQLATSSLILASRMDRLAEPLTADQQVLRPYALGSMEIAPAWSSTFGKSEVLSLFFVIYNPSISPATDKPEVVVDYSFHQRSGDTETFFNKTHPQHFNAQTLPPQFDLALGHQLVAGQSIPLDVFPAGDYRMEVAITDETSGESVTRSVTFSVRGS